MSKNTKGSQSEGGRGNLYIVCPNIMASMYCQNKLQEAFGFQILTSGRKPHFSDRFCVVPPPEGCSALMEVKEDMIRKNLSYYVFGTELEKHKTCEKCIQIQKDKPVICFQKPTMSPDGEIIYDKSQNWIEIFTALKLINLTEKL